jgi:hypothetical protein
MNIDYLVVDMMINISKLFDYTCMFSIGCRPMMLSYPVFTPKLSTHHMPDPGSIVPHIQPKGFTDNQMSRIKYDYYYINSVSKDYDDSQWNEIAEDNITPQERQPGQHVA